MKIKYKRTERRFFTTQCWEEKRVLSMSDLLLVIVPSKIATICPGQLSVTLLMVNIMALLWPGCQQTGYSATLKQVLKQDLIRI